MITSGSATSVDVGELPFDMPKLKRRIRLSQHSDNSNQEPTSLSITKNEEGKNMYSSRTMSVLILILIFLYYRFTNRKTRTNVEFK